MNLKNKIKGLTESKKEGIKKCIVTLYTHTIILLSYVSQVSAVSNGTESLDNIENFICAWMGRIGLIAALIGTGFFCYSMASQDSERRTTYLWWIAGGLMAYAVAKVGTAFFA